MRQGLYRRKAILSRVHKALDAFYLLQRVDWEYDVRETLERILGLALSEVELDGGRTIERGLIIIRTRDGEDLEVQGGWTVAGPDLSFSHTVVQETIERGEPILCENAKHDPRFMEAESIKDLETLSLVSLPLRFDDTTIGALYVESESPANLFAEEDLEFLREFAGAVAPYLKTALTHQDHVQALRELREEVEERYRIDNIIGRSESIRGVFDLIRIAADVDRTVLITGESGSGKELVSRAIHYNGHRRNGKYVVVDCSSLSEHLLESELFGHRRGAFTGASHDKVGAFEAASGGTLFLDEISDAPKPLQQKLRRVLQEGEIRRVGDNDLRKVDVRVICATNKDLPELVRKGEFIHDLFFRINKFPIHIPPLRERRQDIPLLVHHFLEQAARDDSKAPRRITSEAMELLVGRQWAENNIRELKNTVELAADFAPGGAIDRPLLERVVRIQGGGKGPTSRSDEDRAGPVSSGRIVHLERGRARRILLEHRDRLEEGAGRLPKAETPFYRFQLEFSARVIVEGLRECGWKLRPAARLLGISPMKLRGALREFIRSTLVENAGDLDRAARTLDIPEEILRRKAADLGLEDLLEGAGA